MGKKKKSKKGGKKKQSRQKQPRRQLKEKKVAFELTDEVYPATVMEIVGKMGTREGGRQARVKIQTGRDAGKIIRRNVLGPVKVGDVLLLKETEIEAAPAGGKRGRRR